MGQREIELLRRIVEADTEKTKANYSGQHASPISRWIPLEQAIDEAREFLKNTGGK